MKRNTQIIWATAILIHLCAATPYAHPGPFDGTTFKGRIAFSSDGNFDDKNRPDIERPREAVRVEAENFLTLDNYEVEYRHDRQAGVSGDPAPPYPASPVIRRVNWASPGSIRRLARGADNWPITWADDGALYTAYGDGWGFEPRTEKKLSMGFAKVLGGPDRFRGVNIRSSSGETLGQGPAGKKASGILMVDGVLYLWVRNAGNSQLAWSEDHGSTWNWCGWKFDTSFGAPTFLNFGRNYQGARDRYVYVFSFDGDSAYEPADRMVLARVPSDRMTVRAAYEYFVRCDARGNPMWSPEIAKRGAVFEHRGACYRSGISYNAALGRYLWVQVLPGAPSRELRTAEKDPRFRGGFGIYDAPQPWGPWTTVYFTRLWDTGPGESASFPTKWIGADGCTLYMVFSGDDCFSVRKAVLELRMTDARR